MDDKPLFTKIDVVRYHYLTSFVFAR